MPTRKSGITIPNPDPNEPPVAYGEPGSADMLGQYWGMSVPEARLLMMQQSAEPQDPEEMRQAEIAANVERLFRAHSPVTRRQP